MLHRINQVRSHKWSNKSVAYSTKRPSSELQLAGDSLLLIIFQDAIRGVIYRGRSENVDATTVYHRECIKFANNGGEYIPAKWKHEREVLAKALSALEIFGSNRR